MVADLVERFSHDRKVFLLPDFREGQLPKAETPHEQESLKRAIAAAGTQIDAVVYESYGLTKEETLVVEGVGA